MYIHISTGSGIVDRLERKGYLIRERSGEDRRVVQLRITPKGRSIVRRAPVLGFGRLIRDIDKLQSREIRQIGQAMKTILKLMQIDGTVTAEWANNRHAGGTAFEREGKRGQ